MRRPCALSAFLFVAFCLTALAQDHGSGSVSGGGGGSAAPILDNLGDHHRTISTYLPAAQRYFDQGLRLMFAFNVEEAEAVARRYSDPPPATPEGQAALDQAYAEAIGIPPSRSSRRP